MNFFCDGSSLYYEYEYHIDHEERIPPPIRVCLHEMLKRVILPETPPLSVTDIWYRI